MFLPRKLQKRSHAGRSVKASPVEEVSHAVDESRSPSRSSSGSVQPAESLSSTSTKVDVITNGSAGTAGASKPQSNAEAAKLERLVEFLYLRLSPLGVQIGRVGQGDDLYRSITAIPQQPDKSTTIHLARLLILIPGLSSRCKSIDLLSQALQLLVSGPAVKWFVLHPQSFLLEILPAYARFVDDVPRVSSPSVSSAKLAPLLVYVESIPPNVRTRTQAATYMGKLIGTGLVAGVLEPSVVDRWVMGDREEVDAKLLEGKWISGRAFFVLDSKESVDELCRGYAWDLRGREAGGEPIRCLSWSRWVEMREVYRRQQERVQEETRRAACSNAKVNGDDVDIDRKRKHGTKSSTLPIDNSTTSDKWYRGAIILLPLSPTPDSSTPLTLPPTPQLTPALLNRHLKPQLEQQVPESVSYIHPLPDTPMMAIRTAHPHLATALLRHFDQLRPMPPDQEDVYWLSLSEKTHNVALKRYHTLQAKLNP